MTRARWSGVAALLAACSGGHDAPTAPPTTGRLELPATIERGVPVSLRLRDAAGPRVVWSVADTSAAQLSDPSDTGAVITGRRSGAVVQVLAVVGRDTLRGRATVAPPPRLVLGFRPLDTGDLDLYEVALDGGELVRLTPDSPRDDTSPSISGGRLVFTSVRDGRPALYELPSMRGPAVRLRSSSAAESSPALAGQRVAFVSAADGSDRVWIADGTGTATRLTATAGEGAALEGGPAISPDGETVAYWTTDAGSPALRLTGWDRRTTQLLAPDRNAAFAPTWAPDGRSLVFASNRDTSSGGPTSLYRVARGTGSVTRLTHATQAQSDPLLLPDGRLVYVQRTGSATGVLVWIDPAQPARSHVVPLPPGLPSTPRYRP
ncbi:MAG: hypothetical protein MUF21_10810 [Gemmatimonadaceae bacterium]|jgi:Tol biopolymer transport system component|nr:hypothetical protein [Gemmatimonadaceae bacterium]